MTLKWSRSVSQTISGIRIANNRYKLKEVELLNVSLKSKYYLDTTITKNMQKGFIFLKTVYF